MVVSRALRFLVVIFALQVVAVAAMLAPGGWSFTSSWPLTAVLVVTTILAAGVGAPAVRWAMVGVLVAASAVLLLSIENAPFDVHLVLIAWAVQVLVLLRPVRRSRRSRFGDEFVDLDDIPDDQLEQLLDPDGARFSRPGPASDHSYGPERRRACQNGSVTR